MSCWFKQNVRSWWGKLEYLEKTQPSTGGTCNLLTVRPRSACDSQKLYTGHPLWPNPLVSNCSMAVYTPLQCDSVHATLPEFFMDSNREYILLYVCSLETIWSIFKTWNGATKGNVWEDRNRLGFDVATETQDESRNFKCHPSWIRDDSGITLQQRLFDNTMHIFKCCVWKPETWICVWKSLKSLILDTTMGHHLTFQKNSLLIP